jgi:hypothetical protein
MGNRITRIRNHYEADKTYLYKFLYELLDLGYF